MCMVKKISKLVSNKFIFLGIIVVSLLITISSLYSLPSLIMETNNLREEEAALQNEIKSKTEMVEQLQDPEKQAQIARELYHLSEKGELIFVFPE